MKRIAFLFPGQGAQYVGMGKDLFETYPEAREIFLRAEKLLGYPISKILFEGPKEVLTETKHSQLAIFIHSTAILAVLHERWPGIEPTVCAGLSLGEYTALYASKRLSFEETLLLIRDRAHFMNEACENTKGTMSAVLDHSREQIEKIINEVNPTHPVWIANYNCPGQIVISGTHEGVEVASKLCKVRGAKRILPLQVHGAFHSGLMKEAQEKLASKIQSSSLQESPIEFVMNAAGDYVSDLEEIRKFLICQVTSSVHWEETIRKMMDRNIDLYFEIGCGKTLSGINRKITPNTPTYSIDRVADLETFLKILEQEEIVHAASTK